MNDEDFFEEDEPVADVVAAFERGRKGRTRRPRPGVYVTDSGWVSTTTNPGNDSKVAFEANAPAHLPATIAQ